MQAHELNCCRNGKPDMAPRGAVQVGSLKFEGPFLNCSEIRSEPGLFGIVSRSGEVFDLVLLDDSHCLRDCMASVEHESNMLFFSETCEGPLLAIVYYTPDLSGHERALLKKRVRQELGLIGS
jgi:hypothetical protein